MLEVAQVVSALLSKPHSFETKKHGEQSGHIKRHSPCQAELLPKAQRKTKH